MGDAPLRGCSKKPPWLAAKGAGVDAGMPSVRWAGGVRRWLPPAGSQAEVIRQCRQQCCGDGCGQQMCCADARQQPGWIAEG